ncbi:phage tail family protein [Curtobacterium sp. MCBA15_004]|uniref:phage distal tail protein n=1 Tax=Curtobacterium sp. MCBA15_004 TaxID=1898733 RepID=UPI00111493CF|nr:phage tail family protein [Curtobacterium sp. MCBA15_004]WIA97618.1 phage tail family protein [Curtobacterium sp. MCBA15_004]
MPILPDQVTASLNGIVFGGVDQFGVDWSLQELDGWSATSSTTRATQRARRSGSLLGTPFATGRSVSLSGRIFAPTADLLSDAIDRLNAAVTLSDSKLFVTEASRTRYAWMRQSDDVIVKHLMPTIATYSIQLISADWRKFGADVSDRTRLPSTSGGLLINTTNYAWTGAPNASPSTMSFGGVVQRTNLASDPRATSLAIPSGRLGWASRWFGNGSTGTNSTVQNAADGPFGVTSYARKTWTGMSNAQDVGWQHTVNGTNAYPVTAGLQYSVSCWIRGSKTQPSRDGNNGMVVQWYDASGTMIGTGAFGASDKAITAGEWVRYSVTATAPAGAAFMAPYNQVYLSASAWAVGDTLDGTALLVEQSSTVGSYFDGFFASFGGLTVAAVGGLVINAVTVTGQVSLTNPGNDTGPLRLRIDGPCTGPVVTHVGTGDRLVFSSSLVLAAGEWLDIDMEKRQVYANGQSSRAGYITSRGWFGFDPGPNTFAFTAAQYDAASQLTVAGTPAWR